MTVEYVCENCQRDNLKTLAQAEETLVCAHCLHPIAARLSTSMQTGGKVDRCLVCGRIRFYVQKDFNPRLGLLIFAIGVIFSYHTYGLTLLIATLIDFILYKTLKTVTICYHCRAIYRGFEEDPAHRGFDHNLALSLVEKEQKTKQPSGSLT
jgi:DNA-directed RNA polymerase subunit RPC12/RpoP